MDTKIVAQNIYVIKIYRLLTPLATLKWSHTRFYSKFLFSDGNAIYTVTIHEKVSISVKLGCDPNLITNIFIAFIASNFQKYFNVSWVNSRSLNVQNWWVVQVMNDQALVIADYSPVIARIHWAPNPSFCLQILGLDIRINKNQRENM